MRKPKDRATITTRRGVTTIRATGKAAGILFRMLADSRRQDREDKAAEPVAPATETKKESP
jgi:hypothetical protein